MTTKDEQAQEFIKRALTLPDAIGKALDPLGGELRCKDCGSVEPMEDGDAGRYTTHGWPLCCGHMMTWVTQPQIDAEKYASRTWNTDELRADFEVVGFQAPFVVVKRRSDGATGSLQFNHAPRLYYGWEEHT